jgi:hypothetical protein
MSMTKTFPIEVNPSPLPFQRMNFPDIEELSDWIAGRLYKRSVMATPQAVRTWLRSCVADNDTWFVRSGGAVAMARLVRTPLAAPRAEEIFVFCVDGAELDAADLYIPMSKWAVNLDCIRLDVDIFSDVTRAEIVKRLGPVKPRHGQTVWF